MTKFRQLVLYTSVYGMYALKIETADMCPAVQYPSPGKAAGLYFRTPPMYAPRHTPGTRLSLHHTCTIYLGADKGASTLVDEAGLLPREAEPLSEVSDIRVLFVRLGRARGLQHGVEMPHGRYNATDRDNTFFNFFLVHTYFLSVRQL